MEWTGILKLLRSSFAFTTQRLPCELTFISKSHWIRIATIVIFLVLQSTPTHVNGVDGYSEVAPLIVCFHNTAFALQVYSQSFSAGEDFADHGDRKKTLFHRKPYFVEWMGFQYWRYRIDTISRCLRQQLEVCFQFLLVRSPQSVLSFYTDRRGNIIYCLRFPVTRWLWCES